MTNISYTCVYAYVKQSRNENDVFSRFPKTIDSNVACLINLKRILIGNCYRRFLLASKIRITRVGNDTLTNGDAIVVSFSPSRFPSRVQRDFFPSPGGGEGRKIIDNAGQRQTVEDVPSDG